MSAGLAVIWDGSVVIVPMGTFFNFRSKWKDCGVLSLDGIDMIFALMDFVLDMVMALTIWSNEYVSFPFAAR